MSKGKLCSLQKSLQLARIIYFFQRKTPKCKYWILKVVSLETHMVRLAGSEMPHSVFVCSAHPNVLLLVDAMGWDLTYKNLIKKMVHKPESNKWIMHWCKSSPGTETLKEFLDQKLNEHEGDEKFNYCQRETTDRVILTTFTGPYEEYKENLIDVIDDLTRHSYITKLIITNSWYRSKSKATISVKNTASYIPWLYTARGQMVASTMIHCVLALMTTAVTQAFCIKFKQCLFII